MGHTPKHKPKQKATPKHTKIMRCEGGDNSSDSETEKSGGRSHKNMRLILWDPEAMVLALDEYNELCRKHGSENVSMASVAESHCILPTAFWKRLDSM